MLSIARIQDTFIRAMTISCRNLRTESDMRKSLIIIAGALLLGTVATSASAQGWPYYGGGYGGAYGAYRGYGGPGAYRNYARQLRACQQHERLHQELGAEHAEEHWQGLDSYGDHYDLHGALDDAHDAYHDDHPRADLCEGMGSPRYYQPNYGYAPGYGYGYDPYRNG